MSSMILESVALSFDFDHGGVVKEAVEDGSDRRDIADELAPFLFSGRVKPTSKERAK
jgi:microsomal dipeptidase-like Zn-dependent dipeptidase